MTADIHNVFLIEPGQELKLIQLFLISDTLDFKHEFSTLSLIGVLRINDYKVLVQRIAYS